LSKFLCVFALLIGFLLLAFFRQNDLLNAGFQFFLIFRTVEALVKTAGIKAWELRFDGFNHRRSDFGTGGFLANQIVQDKTKNI